MNVIVGCIATVAALIVGFKLGKDATGGLSKRICSTGVKSVGLSSQLENVVQPAASPIQSSIYKLDGVVQGGVLSKVFSQLHHPSTPVTTELMIDLHYNITDEMKRTDPYDHCAQVYMTRTGSATSMSNKCFALAIVSDGDTSPYMHSYRAGTSAKLVNQYQNDVFDSIAAREEHTFLPLFIESLQSLLDTVRSKMGPPILPNGERRAITIMVANEGVMDLVLNFLCSCRSAGIDVTQNMVVFLGQPELAPIVENMGVRTFYAEALGKIPKKAASFYGDNVFGVLMWLKTTSIYVASNAGYDVLFQDTDLVWIKDPLPILKTQKHDIIFMDDGARTPRFTPWYVNSGFYFQKYNPRSLFLMEKMVKSICEIAVTHSHQATLTRHITEAHHLMGLQVAVLAQEDFPSGIVFHHNKQYIAQMKAYKITPVVFHMCWTTSRTEKVTYFKEIGMWYLPDTNSTSSSSSSILTCEAAPAMQTWLSAHPTDSATDTTSTAHLNGPNSLLQHCCQVGGYWEKKRI